MEHKENQQHALLRILPKYNHPGMQLAFMIKIGDLANEDGSGCR